MSDEQPTMSEIGRRLDDISAQLGRMPTTELLLLHVQRQQESTEAVRKDVDDLERDHRENVRLSDKKFRDERTYVDTRFGSLETNATASRRWAIGAVITTAGVVVALLSLIFTFWGGRT